MTPCATRPRAMSANAVSSLPGRIWAVAVASRTRSAGVDLGDGADQVDVHVETRRTVCRAAAPEQRDRDSPCSTPSSGAQPARVHGPRGVGEDALVRRRQARSRTARSSCSSLGLSDPAAIDPVALDVVARGSSDRTAALAAGRSPGRCVGWPGDREERIAAGLRGGPVPQYGDLVVARDRKKSGGSGANGSRNLLLNTVCAVLALPSSEPGTAMISSWVTWAVARSPLWPR